MVTKAELEAELAALKRELAERDAKAGAPTADADAEPEPAPAAPPEQMREALAEALKAHGLDPDDLDLDGLWKQLSDEVADLARERPALTVITAFALGFILGRVSK